MLESFRMFTSHRTTIKITFVVLSALCTFYMHCADIQQFKQCRHHLHASTLSLHSLHASALFLHASALLSARHKKGEMPFASSNATSRCIGWGNFASTAPFYGHGRQPCLLREAVFSVAPTQKPLSLYSYEQMLSPQMRHSPDKQSNTCQWQLHSIK